MDDKPLERPEIVDFLRKWGKFKEEDKRISELRNNMNVRTADFEVSLYRFFKIVVNPMEDAWAKLSIEQKKDLIKMFHVELKL